MSSRKTEKAVLQPEWSFLFDTESLGNKPVTLTIEPDRQQAESVIKRLGLDGLDNLKASITLRRNPGNMVIHIEGLITARAYQKCVVTLAPLEMDIKAPFEAWYADSSQTLSFTKAKRERELEKENTEQPVLDESEDPEPIVNGHIDLGELVVQHLSLNIDPYPKAIGASYEPGDDAAATPLKKGDAYSNPFEALKEWRDKENKS
ncbi:MAG: hypothetical protein KDI90_07905 [Alphaproteobacteria bacterium]|nr:hypothetical protein [Alphaproteobacteria bacterium]MCB9975480.1 hypothetical protein [Rhodospirillales bacterium]